MEIFFPYEKFLHWNLPNISPLDNRSPKPNNPPENVYTHPNNHYYM